MKVPRYEQLKLLLPPETAREVERAPLPTRRKPARVLCGRTKESIRPVTFERFINQCAKEAGHAPPHLFETK